MFLIAPFFLPAVRGRAGNGKHTAKSRAKTQGLRTGVAWARPTPGLEAGKEKMRGDKYQLTIRHAIAGRIRFRSAVLRWNAEASKIFEESLQGLDGIRWVEIHPESASLIVRYDQRIVGQEEIVERLSAISPKRSKGAFARTIDEEAKSAKPKRDSRKSSLGFAAARFAGLTLLAGVVFVREAVLKRPLAQTLFSPLGIVVSLAALPMIARGARRIGEGRVTLESFLGGSIVAAAAAGEVAAAFEILWITNGGELLQTWITERSRRAIREILEVAEKETYVLIDGVEVSVPVEQVRAGDTVVLHTGEKIAVDGRIVKGQAVIDEAPITGMAEPVGKTEGDRVFAGTFVRRGVVFVEAEHVGDRTYLARILRMVEDSLENKAPIEGVADRLARNAVKVGFAVTLATLVATRSVWRAFTVMLVMACPCATILAASSAIAAAMNAAARRHILIKGGRYLEEAGRANVICFDKTGTLTANEPELKQIESFGGLSEDALLQLAYSTEIHNNHPVAMAVKKEAEKRGIEAVRHDVCEYYLGKGVRSEIRGDEILVGSHKLMEQFSVEPDKVKDYLEKVKLQGLTLVFVAKNGKLLGAFGIANHDRAGLESVIGFFRRDGFDKMAMITGDSKYSALEMSCRLNFDECRYSVLPEEKAEIVAGLRNRGDKVLMVGDGINDALALAEADIGIAMGAGGSEVAIEAADIALVKDDLTGVVYVRLLSRETIKVVRRNFWIAAGSNIAGVALGAMGILSPVTAGLVHIAHTLGILANSSRLMFYEPRPADLKGMTFNQGNNHGS